MQLTDLNPDQQKAVTYTGGPLLVLAGAGSGKTRVLTYRVAYLLENSDARPEEILLLTFTNKSAQEMIKRVERLVGREGVVGGTFHSFCARILRRYAGPAGLDRNFVIFDVADQLDTVKRAMLAVGLDVKTIKPGAVLGAISNAKNELVSPHDYANFARSNWNRDVARAYLVYNQLMNKYKAVDFDDLLLLTVKLLKNNPDVLDELQDQFKYILVDEYQDTNKAQYEITKTLAKKYRNLTVVGDAAQAIYSWRGADYRNLLLLKQDFADLKIINLEQNYRSTENILMAANEVIGKNKNHPILALWTDKGAGEKITVHETDTEVEEAEFVVSKIQDSGFNKYSDFAILYRTNAQSRILEEVFLHMSIPYTLVGGVRFYERKEVKDILAYLQLVINPENEIAMKRAEKNGKGRLAKLQIANLNSQIPSLELLDEVLRVTGYLEQFNENDEEDMARLENIKELRSVATQFPVLNELLENITLTEKESKKATRLRQDYGEAKGAVTLMTLHSAKGLEFPTVFLVGMEEGIFPHSRTLMKADEMEEERRLAYVGITRAMEKLYVTYARRRMIYGQRSGGVVSRFVADIPERLVEGPRPPTPKLRLGYVETQWGFDTDGNWKWSPED
ncbi:MAG: UvrD-helicase domain-containing protein [Patescibacteria group bacterium]